MQTRKCLNSLKEKITHHPQRFGLVCLRLHQTWIIQVGLRSLPLGQDIREFLLNRERDGLARLEQHRLGLILKTWYFPLLLVTGVLFVLLPFIRLRQMETCCLLVI
nr:MAG TPA: hypothetical protein [Caudoviricetes sp.]